jgi:hypothetical protein
MIAVALLLASAAPADLIIRDAHIVTVDPRFSIAHAAAVRDGKFIAVGGDAEVMKTAGPNTSVVDLHGKTVLPGFSASVDYYDIKIRDAIATLGAPTLAQGCFAGNQLFCQSITFNPDGSIAFITNTRLNLAQAATRGIDFEAEYSRSHFLGGSLSARVLATRVTKLTFTTPAGVQDRLGQVSNFNRTQGVPKWAGDAFLDYSRGPLRLGLQARYVGAGKFSTILHEGSGEKNTINDNHVPAFVYLTASAAYRFYSDGRRSAELFGIVNNLTGTDPPFIPSGAAGGINESSTNGQFYDVVGRFFRAGIRFTL